MPERSNHSTHAKPMTAAPSADVQGNDVAKLNKRLTDLIKRNDRAEAAYVRASRRCYTPEFKAFLANSPLSDEERGALMKTREEEIGLSDAVCQRTSVAYAAVLEFADELLKLNATTPAVLALKARACLWEMSAQYMRDEGCVRAAEFLTQLAALS
jgi:hypothetical protein